MDVGVILFVLALVLGLCLGVGIGIFLRSTGGGGKAGAELRAKAEAHDVLKEDVSNHLRESARLMDQLSDDYRAIYEHLAIGSQRLTGKTLTTPTTVSAIAHDDDAPVDEPVAANEARKGNDEAAGEADDEVITDMPPPDVPRRDD